MSAIGDSIARTSLPIHIERYAASTRAAAGLQLGHAIEPGADGAAVVFEKSPAAAALKSNAIYSPPETRIPDDSPTYSPTAGDIPPEEQQEIERLKERDAEVKRHEQAHLAAAGPYAASGAAYEYETGPDGQRYAVGGEVQIDVSPVSNDPEATITKAKVVKKAALAPAQPSAQDYRVAAQADQMEMKARQELATAKAEAARQPNDSLGHFSQATPPPLLLDVFV